EIEFTPDGGAIQFTDDKTDSNWICNLTTYEIAEKSAKSSEKSDQSNATDKNKPDDTKKGGDKKPDETKSDDTKKLGATEINSPVPQRGNLSQPRPSEASAWVSINMSDAKPQRGEIDRLANQQQNLEPSLSLDSITVSSHPEATVVSEEDNLAP